MVIYGLEIHITLHGYSCERYVNYYPEVTNKDLYVYLVIIWSLEKMQLSMGCM